MKSYKDGVIESLQEKLDKLGKDFAALLEEKAESDRLHKHAIRYMYDVAPALAEMLGTEEIGLMDHTTDYQGVTFSNTSMTITVEPFAELITVHGMGTNITNEFHLVNGRGDDAQRDRLIATGVAIRAVRRHRPNPMESSLDLLKLPLEAAEADAPVSA